MTEADRLADPCFLIVHPKGILLWDTGGSNPVKKIPEGMDVHSKAKPLSVTLISQLKALASTPTDINYVSVLSLSRGSRRKR